MVTEPQQNTISLTHNILAAGVSGCIAELLTYPFFRVKNRLQIQGELMRSYVKVPFQKGVYSTMITIIREDGYKGLYKGMTLALHRQICFTSVRFGTYEFVKDLYLPYFDKNNKGGVREFGAEIFAGITTGGLAVFTAQPTVILRKRMKYEPDIYKPSIWSYLRIAKDEGYKALWTGTGSHIGRNTLLNVAEIVVYEKVKDTILEREIMKDSVMCHMVSGLIAGCFTTVVTLPVDVASTRFGNSNEGQYKSSFHCAAKMYKLEGISAFTKGFFPSLYRHVSWNICLWVSFEQIKTYLSNHQYSE